MRLIVLTSIAIACLASSPVQAAKILFSPHSGDATVIDLRGANSDKAIVRFRRELDDEVEDCTRELGGSDETDSKKVAACVKEGMMRDGSQVYVRKAWCARLTIYTEFGNFSMINHEKEKEEKFDGKPYRPVRTDWKDHRTGEIVGNCSACNTPTMLSTLQVLCPVFYDNMFRGLDPY